jgi:hypothetical protein
MNNEDKEETIMLYSNSTKLASNVYDFQISFYQKSLSGEQIAKANKEEYHEKLLAEITMSASHTKAVSEILQDAVKRYEKNFGEIKLKSDKK